MHNEETIRQITRQTTPDSSFHIMLAKIDALRVLVLRFKALPIMDGDAAHDALWDDAERLVPQKGVEEAIARTKAKYPKTMAALADTHDNKSDVSVPQKGVDDTNR